MQNLGDTQVNTLKIFEGDEEIGLTMGELDYYIIKNLKHDQFNKIKFKTTCDLGVFFNMECPYIINKEVPKWFNELSNVTNIKYIDL